MEKLYGLEPKKVFKYFEEISQIPRGSGNEKAISDYMVKFAKERNLYVVQDSVNNILIKKEGTVGYENSIDVYKWQDGKETKIEKINGTYHSNYINNFNCEINNGYIKEDVYKRQVYSCLQTEYQQWLRLAFLTSSWVKHGNLLMIYTGYSLWF